jgi:hypothetical protein
MEKFDKIMSEIALLAVIGFSITFIIQILQQRELQKIHHQSVNQLLSETKENHPKNPQLLQKLQQYSTNLETSPVLDINSPQLQIIIGFVLVAAGGTGIQILLEKISQEK